MRLRIHSSLRPAVAYLAALAVAAPMAWAQTPAKSLDVPYVPTSNTVVATVAVGTEPISLGQFIGVAVSSTAVVSSLNPSLFGQSVTFTATVTGGSPTGTVQFKDGATNLGGPVALSGGSAGYTTAALAVGSHSITAVYSGDASNAPSTSSVLTQSVNVASSSTAVVTIGGAFSMPSSAIC